MRQLWIPWTREDEDDGSLHGGGSNSKVRVTAIYMDGFCCVVRGGETRASTSPTSKRLGLLLLQRVMGTRRVHLQGCCVGIQPTQALGPEEMTCDNCVGGRGVCPSAACLTVQVQGGMAGCWDRWDGYWDSGVSHVASSRETCVTHSWGPSDD